MQVKGRTGQKVVVAVEVEVVELFSYIVEEPFSSKPRQDLR